MDRLRAIAASYWTALALGALAVFLHVRWYTVNKAAGGEVVSGFGAALVAIGIGVGIASLLGPGALDRAVASAAPQEFRMFWRKPDPEAGPRRAATIQETRRTIIMERLWIAGVVLVGTLLNGYGPFVARCLGLRV